MKTLTKQERNEIYRTVLKFKSVIKFSGLCYVIMSVQGFDGFKEMEQSLPELFKQAPESLYTQSLWYPLDEEGLIKRIQHVELAIKLTN